MGFNTTVMINNDSLHDIQNDPEFGKNLANAIFSIGIGNKKVSVSSLDHVNAAEVIETHHADQLVAVVVGSNSGVELGYAGNWDLLRKDDCEVEMLRNLAVSKGYNLHKKPQAVSKGYNLHKKPQRK